MRILKIAGRSALLALLVGASPIASAGITTTGAVTPDPSGGTVNGSLFVGNGATGTLTVDLASILNANTLSLGTGGTGNGTVTIVGTGAGNPSQTVINLLGPPDGSTTNNPLEIGNWGTGSMTVSNGAIINGGISGGVPNANCVPAHCNIFIGQTAGSSGTLTLTGAGTTASLAGGFFVGNASVFTMAANGFDFGTPGGTSTGIVNVSAGAALNTYSASLASVFVSAASLGTEQAFAHVTVDGAGSIWTVSTNPINSQTASISIGSNPGGTATLDVTHGGQVNVTGAQGFIGVGDGGNGTLTIGTGGQVGVAALGLGNQTTGVGTVVVGSGSGSSALNITNSLGVGNQSTATSTLTVNTGGTVTISAANGNLGIGNSTGSHGAVTVDGGLISLTGLNSSVGVGNSGTGALTLQNGGQLTMAGQNFGVSVGGTGGSGTLTVQSGATLTASSLNIATQATGVGVVNVIGTTSGAQTVLNLIGPANGTDGKNPLTVGNWGNGTLTVSNGAIVNAGFSGGVPNSNCVSNLCNVFIGNAAGSTALVTLTGAGTTANLAGGFIVGAASVTTNPPNAFNFGTPGGTTHATVQVLNGATLNTYQATISNGPGGPNLLGTEQTVANVAVDGAGSIWNVTRNAVTGTQAQITVGRTANSTGTLDVTHGGQVVITGSRLNPLTDNQTPGLAIAGTSGTAGGTGTVNVNGAGSAIVINGDTGFINLGRNAGTGELNITNGGQVYGGGSNGLVNVNIARLGSNATLTVDGVGSQLTLSGVCGTNTGCDGNGAFINIGRDAGSVATVNVTNGGAIVVRDGGQAANNGSTGFWLGRDAGSSGTMTVSGPGSQVTVEQTGAGTQNPFIILGRAGTGQMLITDGASVAVNGTLEREFIVGNTDGVTGGTGILTVSNGGQVSASWFAVGNNSNAASIGSNGTATFNDASLNIDGITVNPSNGAITGGGIRVGRGPGSVGVLDLQNTTQVIINTATTTPEIYLGGTGVSPGGNGTIHMSGGSSIAFTGSGATPNVVIGHSGTGLMTMTGGSSLVMPSDGSIILGATAPGVGTLQMDGGSSITTGTVKVGSVGQGTITMTSGTMNAGNTYVGGAGTGTFSVSNPAGDGTIDNVTGNLTLGNQASGNGTYSITGNAAQTNTLFAPGGNGAANPPGSNGQTFDPGLMTNVDRAAPNGALIVGNFGMGTFTQGMADLSDPGNTVNVAGDLVLGNQVGSRGLYTLNTGTLTVGGQIVVGNGSQGANVFTQNGGNVTVTALASANSDYVSVGADTFVGWLTVGGGSDFSSSLNSGTGTYVLHSGVINANVQIGNTGTGTFNQSGGTVNAGALWLGDCGGCNGGNASGTYNLTGTGVINAVGESIGLFGHGEFMQNGAGTQNNVSGALLIADTVKGTPDNVVPNRSGLYTLAAGQLNTQDTIVGSQGRGTFVQSGGLHTVSGNLVLGRDNPPQTGAGTPADPFFGGPAEGTYNHTGGIVTVGSWYDNQVLANGQIVGVAAAGNLVVGAAGNGTYNLGASGQANATQWGGYPGSPPGGAPPAFNDAVNAPWAQIFGDVVAGRDAGSTGNINIAGDGSTLWVNYVANSGTGGTMVIGRDGTGIVTQTNNSTVYLDGGLALGLNATGNGSYTMNGGSLSVGGTLNIGGSDDASGGPLSQTTINAGSGSVTQNAGGVTVIGNLNVATNQNAIGSYTLTGGTLDVGGVASIGNNGGSGTYTQTGGSATFAGLAIGTAPGTAPVTSGMVSVTGNASTLTVNGNTIIARDPGTSGSSMTIGTGADAPTVAFNGYLTVGGGDHGTLNIKSGTVSVTAVTYVGGSPTGVGSVAQTGGSFSTSYLDIGTVTGSGSPSNSYTVSNNGIVTVSNNIAIGSGLTVSTPAGSGGAFTQADASQVNVQGSIYINNGTYNLNGGTLTVGGSVILGDTKTGAQLNQNGGTVATITNDLNVGQTAGMSGTYALTGGSLTTGRTIVGDAGTGVFNQSGGTHSTGQLAVGSQATGNGTYNLSSGAVVNLTGASSRVVVGDAGTGLLTLIEGSSLNVQPGGSVIVGASATGNGRIEMAGGSSINAGALFGIGYDQAGSTGGTATVVLDGSSNITATTIALGSGGCLAGTGTLHGNVVMNGATSINGCDTKFEHVTPTNAGIEGILHPGNSPGRIVIDGGFQFISGTIVLEVESDGSGGFLTDEIVFSGGSAPAQFFAGLNIVYTFLDDTDPTAFENSGLWNLDTFFKTNSSPSLGSAGDMGISTRLVGTSETLADLFMDSVFDATANDYVFQNLVFTPDGAPVPGFEAIPVASAAPEPSTFWLLLIGSLLLIRYAGLRRRAMGMHRVASGVGRRGARYN